MFWQPLHARKSSFPRSRTSRFFPVRSLIWRALKTAAFSFLNVWMLGVTPFEALGCVSKGELGQLGGDLGLLKRHYSAPKGTDESNYVIDLWEGQNLRTIAQMNGLTNNHALLINCHGRRAENGKYALY